MKNIYFNLHDVIMFVSILESIFLCIFFGLMQNKKVLANRILACLFLLVTGTLMSELLIWNSHLQALTSHSRIAPMVVSACLLLEGPTLYLYLRTLSHGTKLWQYVNALHLLPAVICVAIISVFNITTEDWLPAHWLNTPPNTYLAVLFIWALFKSLPAAYVIACFYAEHRLRCEMKQMYSSISRWELMAVDILLVGFFLRWCWSFIGYLLSSHLSSEANELIGNVSDYLTAILLNVLFVFGFVDRRQLINVQSSEENAKTSALEIPKEKIEAIESGINTQKLHLDSEINLKNFADQVGLRPRDVSHIIKSHYHSNFFEFVNRFRIEEAKRLLMDDECKDVILQIVYKSGFNSPSAFHRFFKRVEGITPSQYRDREKAVVKA